MQTRPLVWALADRQIVTNERAEVCRLATAPLSVLVLVTMCTATPNMHVADRLLQQRLPTPFLLRQLIPGVDHRPARGAVADRIVGEGLRRRQQGVAR